VNFTYVEHTRPVPDLGFVYSIGRSGVRFSLGQCGETSPIRVCRGTGDPHDRPQAVAEIAVQ
jgi:hypothetical protein